MLPPLARRSRNYSFPPAWSRVALRGHEKGGSGDSRGVHKGGGIETVTLGSGAAKGEVRRGTMGYVDKERAWGVFDMVYPGDPRRRRLTRHIKSVHPQLMCNTKEPSTRLCIKIRLPPNISAISCCSSGE